MRRAGDSIDSLSERCRCECVCLFLDLQSRRREIGTGCSGVRLSLALVQERERESVSQRLLPTTDDEKQPLITCAGDCLQRLLSDSLERQMNRPR